MSAESAIAHLDKLGVTSAELQLFVRNIVGDAPALLVGSVAEGLANHDSDIDILVLADNRQKGMTFYSPQFEIVSAVRHPAGFDVQFEYWAPSAIEPLCGRFKDGINLLLSDSGDRDSRFVHLDDAEGAVLHRLRSGIILGGGDLIADMRTKYLLDHLPILFFFRSIGTHFAFLEDTIAQTQGGDVDTAFGMLRLSMTFLGMALLNSVGVTVVNTKWTPVLLKRNATVIGEVEVRDLLALLGVAVTSDRMSQIAAQAIAVSVATLESIVRRIPEYGPGLKNYQARMEFRREV